MKSSDPPAPLHFEKGGMDRINIGTGTTKTNHCLHNEIVGTDRIELGSIINMIWSGYGSVYTVLREGSVTVRARNNEGRYVFFHCAHEHKVAQTKMDDILKYWFLFARQRKRSILRCRESNQIGLRARLRGKSKRRAMSVLTTMLLCNSTVEKSIWQIPRTSAWFDLASRTSIFSSVQRFFSFLPLVSVLRIRFFFGFSRAFFATCDALFTCSDIFAAVTSPRT